MEQLHFSEASTSPLYVSPAHSFNLSGSVSRGGTKGLDRCAYSGSQLLLVVKLTHLYTLRLIRYHPSTSSSSLHLLKLPHGFDLDAIEGIWLDDHRGVVFLSHRSGLVTILPYA